ncbi:hypothetical protein ACFVWG_21130 [Kribbella sp. NPDC058245]|uniref:hypothetical protein n=1 Tax=Kribbella sp. NPDC058245 TaxID=3346399 RepID=UPI0036EA6035
MLFRGSIALLTAGGLLLGMNTATAAGTEPNEAADPEVSALPDSSTLQTPVVSKGRVLRSDGTPAAGSNLVLLAWPSNDVTDKQVVGDTVKLQPIARATSDANGQFEVRIASNSSLEPLAGRDGIVNMELTAEKGDDAVLPFSFPRKLNVTKTPDGERELVLSNVNSDESEIAVAEPGDLELTLQGAGVDKNAPVGEPAPETDDADAVIHQEPRTTPLQKEWTTKLVADYGPKWDLVGQHWSTTTGVLTQFSFLDSSTSEIGVGASVSGKYGSFKKSGTIARSADGDITFPRVGANAKQFHDTAYRFGRYEHTQWSIQGQIIQRYYTVRALNWEGGARTRNIKFTPDTPYCSQPWGAGTNWAKTRTKAILWTNGYDVTNVVGLELSTVSGYSIKTKISYTFQLGRKLCGEKGPFDGNALKLVSR